MPDFSTLCCPFCGRLRPMGMADVDLVTALDGIHMKHQNPSPHYTEATLQQRIKTGAS